MRKICIYPGRFQPFHKSHYAVYSYLVKRYGKKNVYIYTSDKVEEVKSPFNFKEKQKIISTMFDISESNVLLCKTSPYNIQSLFDYFNPDQTVVIFANTGKDDRLSKNKWFQKQTKNQSQYKPMSEIAYYTQVPYMDNKLNGKQVNGTLIREIFQNQKIKIKDKQKFFQILYGKFDKEIFQLMHKKISKNKLVRQFLLKEGGLAGHMSHPFEDNQLTIGNIKDIINKSLSGKLNLQGDVSLKVDGQNINITWRDGNLLGSRNKGHTKNRGQNALNIERMADLFKDRDIDDVKDAFVFAMTDLESAIGKLNKTQVEQIFNEGRNWLNLEIVYEKSQNVIPYGKSMLVLHGITQYDDNGNPVEDHNDKMKRLYGLIEKTNQKVQKTYSIEPPQTIKLDKVENFNKVKARLMAKVYTLQKKYNLSDSNSLYDYHVIRFTKLLKDKSKEFDYDLRDQVIKKLFKRWFESLGSYKVSDIKKDVDNKEFLDWLLQFDKKQFPLQLKRNLKQWQQIFLEVGIEVVNNLTQFADEGKFGKKIKDQVDNLKHQIYNTDDDNRIKKFQNLLQKINDLGGMQKLLPVEGVVFIYKGNKYKLTGMFAPLNQLLGMIRYGR